MYSIGKFAQMCRTTIKTLRFYDRMGVLKPDYINEENGYRYYESKKIMDYYKIVSLKTAGLTITEIRDTLASKNDIEILKILDEKESLLLSAYEQCRELKQKYKERLEMKSTNTNQVSITKNYDSIFVDNGVKTALIRIPANCIDAVYEMIGVFASSYKDDEINNFLDDLCSVTNESTAEFYYSESVLSERHSKAISDILSQISDDGKYYSIIIFADMSSQLTSDEVKSIFDPIFKKIGKTETSVTISNVNNSTEVQDYFKLTVLAFR